MKHRQDLSWVELQQFQRRNNARFTLLGFLNVLLGLCFVLFVAFAFTAHVQSAFAACIGVIVIALTIRFLEGTYCD